jgi:hypothetical protein
MNKVTRQGVRDLSCLHGKSSGVKLAPLPIPSTCNHRKTEFVSVEGAGELERCLNCDTYVG